MILGRLFRGSTCSSELDDDPFLRKGISIGRQGGKRKGWMDGGSGWTGVPLSFNPCTPLPMHLDLGAWGTVQTLFISCSGYATAVVDCLLGEEGKQQHLVKEVKLVDEENNHSREFIKVYKLFAQNALILTVSGGTLCLEEAMLIEQSICTSIQFQRLVLLETVFSCDDSRQELFVLKGTETAQWPELNISELSTMLLASTARAKVQLLVAVLENYLGNTSFSAAGLAELCSALEAEGMWSSGLFERLGEFDQAKFIAKSKARGYRAMYI